MNTNERTLATPDLVGSQQLRALDPARFESIAEHPASRSKSLERAEDDGWNPGPDQRSGEADKCCAQDGPEVVASAWRVLNEPYAFPYEAEYRAAAERGGCEVVRSVEPDHGGYRHELVLESRTPEADPSGKATVV